MLQHTAASGSSPAGWPRSAAGWWRVLGLPAGLAVGWLLAAIAAEAGVGVAIAVPLSAAVVVLGLRRPAWAIGLFAAAMPFSRVDVLGVNVVLAGAVATSLLVVGLRLLRGERLLVAPAMFGWLVGLWSLALLASVLGVDPAGSAGPLSTLAAGLLLLAAVVTVTESAQDLRLVTWLVLATAGAMCLFALADAGQARAAYGGTLVEGRSQGSFAQPNELGTFAGMTLALAGGWLLAARARGRRLAAVVAVAAALALVSSLSRGAWIGTVAAIAGTMVLLPRRRGIVVGGLLAAALAVTAAVVLVPESEQLDVVRSRVESFADPTGNPYDDRPTIYREGLRQVQTRPLTGYGLGSFPHEARRQLENGVSEGPQHAHNTLLTVSAETGLVTALLLAAYTAVVALRTRRRALTLAANEGTPRATAGDGVRLAVLVGAGAALTLVVGQGIVDFSLRNPTIHFMVFVTLGLLLSAGRRR